jgi:endonuclease G
MYACKTKIKRTNKFTPDPAIPSETNLKKDYTRSGYDRGHNMPAEDNCCSSTGMK